ncbi:50S ribosomal protein L31, partial [Striga asiatica]
FGIVAMVDSSQRNEKIQGYEKWTSEESNELLRLVVDAAKRGWRDKSGNLSKVIVEKHILPPLNAKLGNEKTYAQYKNRVKWFKKQYDKYNDVTKKFTADEHVWEDYFKSHPGDTNYKTDAFPEYEDLRIVVGCGTAIGTNSVAIGDDVEETIFETEERMENINSIDDLMCDPDCEVFVNSNSPFDHMALSPMHSPPFAQHKSSEKRPSIRKRNRTSFEANPKSTASEPDSLIESVNKVVRALESVNTKEYTCWGIIKEIPNLDDDSRFKVLDLLNTRAKKAEFWNMAPDK